jgi:hypothetical protein
MPGMVTRAAGALAAVVAAAARAQPAPAQVDSACPYRFVHFDGDPG